MKFNYVAVVSASTLGLLAALAFAYTGQALAMNAEWFVHSPLR